MATSWQAFQHGKSYPSLQKDITVDTAIVGGGITGILIAYRLAQAGKKVALIEAEAIGNGATAATTAFITKVIDTPLAEVAELFGAAAAKIVWDSGQGAIDEFEKLINAEGIDCEFIRCSNYSFASRKKDVKALEEEFRMYKKFNIPATLRLDGSDLHFPNFGYLEIPRQAKFDPGKFIYPLVRAAVKSGVKVFEKTEALEISGDGPVAVRTPRGRITAENVVIATYKPFTDKSTNFKKGMYKSYVFELAFPRGMLPEGIYEDQENPYHYFRVDRQKGKDRVIVGGEDHKDIFGDRLENKSFKGLKRFVQETFKHIDYTISRKWSGPILEPSDGLALIGEIKKNYYVATAFSGNGMTYSMISSKIIPDLIRGRKNVWQNVYDPKRFLWRPKRLGTKAKDYVEEFFNGALKNVLR